MILSFSRVCFCVESEFRIRLILCTVKFGCCAISFFLCFCFFSLVKWIEAQYQARIAFEVKKLLWFFRRKSQIDIIRLKYENKSIHFFGSKLIAWIGVEIGFAVEIGMWFYIMSNEWWYYRSSLSACLCVFYVIEWVDMIELLQEHKLVFQTSEMKTTTGKKKKNEKC